MKGYLPAPAWHCTFYTPAGRQRRKLGSKNKRQAERRAREITEFIQREDWEALSKLDWKPKPHAGTFSIFVRAVTYGYCKTNPAASVTTKKEPVKVKDVLDDDEFGTVVALLMATLEIKSLYDMWMQLVALLGGGFAGTGTLAGAVTSVAGLYATRRRSIPEKPTHDWA
ncbi:MAG TPA: hypothetical protein EYQ31_02625 [Candidatus Handelsmanbacteria bacterium]|nr:hypothetical protein [Candidatus Handelsmanbacteria bacterium]